METWGQEQLAAVLGARDAATCKVLAVSLTGGDMTVNGVTQTPVAVGTDHPDAPGNGGDDSGPAQACFATWFSVTASGITGHTATQGSNSISGTIPAFPQAGQNYTLPVTACDDGGEATAIGSAGYSYIRSLYDSGVTVPFMLKTDDPVYADLTQVDDSSFSGHQSTGAANTTLKEYDYALAYVAQLGLLGDPSDDAIRDGHDPDRKWCLRNIPHLFMMGDHPFTDNIGWTNVAQSTAQWAPGIAVWDALYGSVMPPRLSGESDFTDHTEAMHWGISLGDIRIFVGDRTTVADGSAGLVSYGDTQIDEGLTYLNAGSEFHKVMVLGSCIRYLDGDEDGASGANEPLYNERPVEYQRLVTDDADISGQDGMQERYNDAAGAWTWSVWTCDHHNGQALRHEKAAAGNFDVTESYVSITAGTSFGNQNHSVDISLVPGASFSDTTMDYVSQDYASNTRINTLGLIEVDGTRSTKRVIQKLVRTNHEVLWQGQWEDGQSGNLPGNVTTKSV